MLSGTTFTSADVGKTFSMELAGANLGAPSNPPVSTPISGLPTASPTYTYTYTVTALTPGGGESLPSPASAPITASTNWGPLGIIITPPALPAGSSGYNLYRNGALIAQNQYPGEPFTDIAYNFPVWNIASGGSGYSVGTCVYISAAGGNATAVVTSVGSGGVVTGIQPTIGEDEISPGFTPTTAMATVIWEGAGSGLTITLPSPPSTGTAISPFATTIMGVTNATTITVATAASNSTSNQQAFYGYDAATPIQQAINAAFAMASNSSNNGIYLNLKGVVSFVQGASYVIWESINRYVQVGIEGNNATINYASYVGPAIIDGTPSAVGANSPTYTTEGEVDDLNLMGPVAGITNDNNAIGIFDGADNNGIISVPNLLSPFSIFKNISISLFRAGYWFSDDVVYTAGTDPDGMNYAVGQYGTWNGELKDCRISCNWDGIGSFPYGNGGDELKNIMDCKIYNNGHAGIVGSSNDAMYMEGGAIEYNGFTGLYGSPRITMVGVHEETNHAPMWDIGGDATIRKYGGEMALSGTCYAFIQDVFRQGGTAPVFVLNGVQMSAGTPTNWLIFTKNTSQLNLCQSGLFNLANGLGGGYPYIYIADNSGPISCPGTTPSCSGSVTLVSGAATVGPNGCLTGWQPVICTDQSAANPVKCTPGNVNSSCTGMGAPYTCCSGSGTGECGTISVSGTGSDVISWAQQ